MDSPSSPVSEAQTVAAAAAKVDPTADDNAADLALQEQLIKDVTSDDLQVLRKIGFKTILKPHQKVISFVLVPLQIVVLTNLISGRSRFRIKTGISAEQRYCNFRCDGSWKNCRITCHNVLSQALAPSER